MMTKAQLQRAVRGETLTPLEIQTLAAEFLVRFYPNEAIALLVAEAQKS